MRLHLLGGFLGAGKTTAMRRLARHFQGQGERVAVVTNDQGHLLVDTEIVRRGDVMVREVGGGCLCCRYTELADALTASVEAGVTVALVEAVGSCTDLVATVIAPMSKLLPHRIRLAPLSILVDPWRVREMSDGRFAPDVQYLFRKQIEEADVIVLTRADRAPPEVTDAVREINREAAIVAFSGSTGEGLTEWLAARPRRPAAPLVIDYDRYAAAEAMLGWLNGLAVVQSAEPFSPAGVVRKLFGAMRDTPMAHLKVAVLWPGAGAAALVRRGDTLHEELGALPAEARAMRLLVNGRVAMPPRELESLVRRALAAAAAPAEVSFEQLACFEPSRPTPLHRYACRCDDDTSPHGDDASSGAPYLESEGAAQSALEAAQRRSSFLAEASRALSASLDYQRTLTRVAELAVPFVADFCAVYVEEPGTPLHPMAVAYHEPRALELARAFATEYAGCVTQRDSPSVCSVLRTCSSDCMHSDEVGSADACGVYREMARDLGLATTIAVPLVARERALGVVVFGYRDRRGAPHADLALGEELAGRAALAIDNARLYGESQQAIRARDEFLSVASHELRTPAQSLVLGVQLLQRVARAGHLGTGASALGASVLEKLERQSHHLEQLIDRLLDVTRIQSGQLKLDLEQGVDLGAVAREVVGRMLDIAAQSGCAIELRTEEVTGEFDRLRLAQVVSNLVSNALRYGAGTPVDVVVQRAAGHAELTVRDRGVGIAPEAQAMIFEPFKRAASARHYGGLGLGLYIVRQIVSAHGGTVRVDSTLGAGATFVVSLPHAAHGALHGEAA